MAGQQQGCCPLAVMRTVLDNDEGILRGEKPRSHGYAHNPKDLNPNEQAMRKKTINFIDHAVSNVKLLLATFFKGDSHPFLEQQAAACPISPVTNHNPIVSTLTKRQKRSAGERNPKYRTFTASIYASVTTQCSRRIPSFP